MSFGIAAGILAVENGKVLMVQERQEKCKGKWGFPIGNLDEDRKESVKECAVREGREETGFDFRLKHSIGIYHQYSSNGDGKPKIGFIFLAEIVGGKLSINKEEIMDAAWFSFKKIDALEKKGLLRADYVKRVIDDFRANKKVPLNCIVVL